MHHRPPSSRRVLHSAFFRRKLVTKLIGIQRSHGSKADLWKQRAVPPRPTGWRTALAGQAGPPWPPGWLAHSGQRLARAWVSFPFWRLAGRPFGGLRAPPPARARIRPRAPAQRRFRLVTAPRPPAPAGRPGPALAPPAGARPPRARTPGAHPPRAGAAAGGPARGAAS